MSREIIEQALNELITMYKEMENEYGINLTNQVLNAEKVLKDIPEAIWYAEVGKDL